MTKRILGAALALISAGGLTAGLAAGLLVTTAPAASARPIAHRGADGPANTGSSVRSSRLAASAPGDCELGFVHCMPDRGGSCTGYSSQTTPPASIQVLVRTSATTVQINQVPFETYVEDVLPNEWVRSFDGDSLRAGAVAVKSYAWYWVTHFGGYLNDDQTQCFDVTDDSDFQNYVAGSATSCPDQSKPTCTTRAVQQTWPVVARENGQVFQAHYRNYFHSTTEACGSYLSLYPNQMSQYGSQNCNEANSANKYNVILQTYYGSGLQLATTAQLRTQHDFRYLHTSTEATFNSGTWALNDVYDTVIHYGNKGDVPVVNTVGDGFARVGVYRPSNHTWYFGSANGTSTSRSFQFGTTGDEPVAAQYNGLANATQAAVFRPSNGTWYFATASGQVASAVQYGARGDIPVPGRWIDASTDSIAVFRPSTGSWYLRNGTTVQFGAKGDIPVPADYTGDGRTDIAVFRPSTDTFYVRGQAGVQYGAKGDIPVTGDFTGDGKADLAVYRPSNHTFYVRGATTQPAVGSGTVVPIGKAPYAD